MICKPLASWGIGIFRRMFFEQFWDIEREKQGYLIKEHDTAKH